MQSPLRSPKSISLLICLLSISTTVGAQKTYTPAQLHRMVDSGNYPKQGSVITKSERIDYSTCIRKIESMIASVRPNYPTRTVVSTNLMRTEKLWTNDGAMTVTCSAPDNKLIITSATYQ